MGKDTQQTRSSQFSVSLPLRHAYLRLAVPEQLQPEGEGRGRT